MTLSNHMITGAVIGAVATNPWVGVPVAFVSHFVLDMLPHYGYEGPSEMIRDKFTLFWFVTITDGLLVISLLSILFFGYDRLDLVLYALIAASPDLPWIYLFLTNKFKTVPYKNAFLRFHAHIQQLESPQAIVMDIIYAVGVGCLLYSLVS